MTYDITRTELVWPGKYDENGKPHPIERLSLPFQVIERVNESRATREARKATGPSLFDIWQADEGSTFEDGWRNKLVWGDNRLVMSSLLDQFAGKVDLVYIDPPFATGSDFSVSAQIGEGKETIDKEQSIIEEKAYRDTWGGGIPSYLNMITERIRLIHELLSPTGALLFHCDYRVEGFARLVLDEVFGVDRLANVISWCYTGPGNFKKWFPRRHDTILYYTKTAPQDGSHTFNFDAPEVRSGYSKSLKAASKATGIYAKRADDLDYEDYDAKGKLVEDWWSDITPVGRIQTELLGYPTQKPEKLLERIIGATTKPGNLVADFFGGSGTTAAVAEKMGRRWITCDLGRYAVHTIRKRLLDIEGCKPFEMLNLGMYERQYWKVATFGEDLDGDDEIALYEYIAFMLKLYGAVAMTGSQWVHGKKGKALVHVGPVDAPVTISDIDHALDDCERMSAKELHVLGWEWEMGLYDPMVDLAQSRGVKLIPLQIPREVMEPEAARKGDVRFFELAYSEFDLDKKGKSVTVTLTDFVIPNAELVPADVRKKIDSWADYVDYWAVDWNFSDDTFHQNWVTYRTRHNRKLALTSDTHTYDKAGEYSVMVKVIDIFGNDTSRIVRVKVK